MSSRIDDLFADLKSKGRKAFVAFITAGDPDLDISAEILAGLPAAGADIIELGMPFTDPMADGPAIQAASQRALVAGQNLAGTLDMVAAFRTKNDTTPLVLMGYYNPIYHYGVDKFIAEAKQVGVDGLIIVDLPAEEDDELCPAIQAGLNFIRLPRRQQMTSVPHVSPSLIFVYYVSITGITGAAAPGTWPIILRA